MYRELLGAYALDAVTRDEEMAVNAHLEECDSCRMEVATLRSIVGVLPLSVAEMEPPVSLRASILSAIEQEPNVQRVPAVSLAPPVPENVVSLDQRRSRRNWLPWAAAAALLAISIGLLGWNFSLRDAEEPERETIALAATNPESSATAEATYLEDEGVLVLTVEDMPEIAEDEVFQVWLVNDAGTFSAGVFSEDQQEFAVAADPANYDLIAITTEPGPVGVPVATSDPILLGEFETA